MTSTGSPTRNSRRRRHQRSSPRYRRPPLSSRRRPHYDAAQRTTTRHHQRHHRHHRDQSTPSMRDHHRADRRRRRRDTAREYLDATTIVHAYATTVYKAQGITVDPRVPVRRRPPRAGERLHRPVTRHATENHIYLAHAHRPEPDHGHLRTRRVSTRFSAASNAAKPNTSPSITTSASKSTEGTMERPLADIEERVVGVGTGGRSSDSHRVRVPRCSSLARHARCRRPARRRTLSAPAARPRRRARAPTRNRAADRFLDSNDRRGGESRPRRNPLQPSSRASRQVPR